MLKYLSGFSIIISASFLLLIQGLYYYGLTALPENKEPSKSVYTKKILYSQWVVLGGRGNMEMQSIYPISFVVNLFLQNGKFEKNLPKNNILAAQSGRHLLWRNQEENYVRMGLWHLYSASASIWVSQNWSAEQALNTLLDSYYYGHQLFGIRAAAKVYFKKTPETLNLNEIIFLMVLTKAPNNYYPINHSKRLLRQINLLVKQLSKHYPRLYPNLKPIKALPFSYEQLPS